LKINLPNTTAAMIMGVMSIPSCCCCGGFAGLGLGLLALYLASEGIKEYHEEPELYKESSFKNIETAKWCAITGIVFSLLMMVIMASMIWGRSMTLDMLKDNPF